MKNILIKSKLDSICSHLSRQFSLLAKCLNSHQSRHPAIRTEDIIDKRLEKFYSPTNSKVEEYRLKFPEPVRLIHELTSPLVESDKENSLSIYCKPKFNGRLWKASIQFTFPSTFTVVGIHKDRNTAKEYAYLEACEIYRMAGFISKAEDKVTVSSPDMFLKGCEDLCMKTAAPRYRKENNFKMLTSQIETEGKGCWVTEIRMFWPVPFSVTAEGKTPYSSQFKAALLGSMKLKVMNLLNDDNRVVLGKFLIGRSLKEADFIFIPDVEDYNPDCIMHVDSSYKGIGGHLKIKGETGVRWFSEPWPIRLRDKYFPIISEFRSSFGEVYALVTACYTWKHRFRDKRVLCYADCLSTVNMINRGLYVSRQSYVKYNKVCSLFFNTLRKYNIQFLAVHKCRDHNKAADSLSKLKVEDFRKEVPEAYEKAKKIKQISFCNPCMYLNAEKFMKRR